MIIQEHILKALLTVICATSKLCSSGNYYPPYIISEHSFCTSNSCFIQSRDNLTSLCKPNNYRLQQLVVFIIVSANISNTEMSKSLYNIWIYRFRNISHDVNHLSLVIDQWYYWLDSLGSYNCYTSNEDRIDFIWSL